LPGLAGGDFFVRFREAGPAGFAFDVFLVPVGVFPAIVVPPHE